MQIIEGTKDTTEVLTPLAASYLFGRSGEAVRTAVRKGHVASPFSFWFDGRQIRMVDLQSALAYWGTDGVYHYRNLGGELQEMRLYGEYVHVDIHGRKYRILHAGSSLVVPTSVPVGKIIDD